MNGERTVSHDHLPLFRVLRAGHSNPLDASHSRSRPGRWNTPDFAALYICCSELTARAVVRDRVNVAAVDLEELQLEARPQLFELEWIGQVVDVVSEAGVRAAGFSSAYPDGPTPAETRVRAAKWHDGRHEGVVCRSASLFRLGFRSWTGEHLPWGEVAVFIEVARSPVTLRRKRTDIAWFRRGS